MWAILAADPVDMLSRIDTWWPSLSKASQRCEPMNPAPPVMKTRMGRSLSCRLGAARFGFGGGDINYPQNALYLWGTQLLRL